MMRPQRLSAAISLVGLVVLMSAACGGDNAPAQPADESPQSGSPPAATTGTAVRFPVREGRALLEPESGTYFGANLDWGSDVAERFPRITMINWFEWSKAESEIGGATIDWTVTHNAQIREAFVADLPRQWLRFAPAP